MTEKEICIQIEAEIKAVIKKYDLKNCSFCCTQGEHYIGLIGIEADDKTLTSSVNSVLNIGRLWQAARNGVRQVLDGFEGGWKR